MPAITSLGKCTCKYSLLNAASNAKVSQNHFKSLNVLFNIGIGQKAIAACKLGNE